MDKPVDITSGKIRIKDIAERAKVSVGTVDRVLHNRGEVAKETRDLINTIISELSYTPNIIASTLAQKKVFRFSALLPMISEGDAYWQFAVKGIENAEKEIGHYGVAIKKYFFDIRNQESMEEQMQHILNDHTDGVMIMPVFNELTEKFAQTLSEKNIPYSFIDSALFGANPIKVAAQDSFQSGYLAAKLISYSVAKDATVLIMNVARNHYNDTHFNERVRGFKAYLAEHNITETKIRTIEITQGDEVSVKQSLMSAFTEYSFVRGVFVTGYDVYKVAKFIDEKKLVNIRLIGYDLSENNIQYLRKGTIDFLLSQRPEQQAYKGIMALFNHLVLKKPALISHSMPIDIITKENVDYYPASRLTE